MATTRVEWSPPGVAAVGVLVNSSDWPSQFEGGTLKAMALKFRGLLGDAVVFYGFLLLKLGGEREGLLELPGLAQHPVTVVVHVFCIEVDLGAVAAYLFHGRPELLPEPGSCCLW